MKRKTALVVLLVLAVLFVVMFNWDSSLSYLASNFKNPEFCGGILNLDKRDGCYYDLAFELNNSAVCDLMSNESPDLVANRDPCYFGFIANNLNRGDEKICEKIVDKNFNLYCFVTVAGNLKKPSVCEKFSGDKKTVCIASAEWDSLLCREVNDLDTRDFCFSYLAKLKTDTSLCYNISSGELVEDCLDNIDDLNTAPSFQPPMYFFGL
jgi:hypothetical protein